jgi:hypothetical protein
VKRRLLQFLFAIGVVLTLVAALAMVRGFGASDLFAVGWGRNPSKSERIGDQLTLFTSHEICGVSFRRQHDRTTDGSAVDYPFHPFGAWHEAVAPRPFTVLQPEAGCLWRRLRFRVITSSSKSSMSPYVTQWGTSEVREVGLVIPTWFVALLAAGMIVVPARSLHRGRRLRRRRAAGQCLACGYDLRGAEHECCPECGAAVAAAAV